MKMVKKGYRMSNHTIYSHKEWVIQYNDHAASMNEKSNLNSQGGHSNWMSESSLSECKPQSTLNLTTDQNPNWLNWALIEFGVQ